MAPAPVPHQPKRLSAPVSEANDWKGVIDLAALNNESQLGTGSEPQDR